MGSYRSVANLCCSRVCGRGEGGRAAIASLLRVCFADEGPDVGGTVDTPEPAAALRCRMRPVDYSASLMSSAIGASRLAIVCVGHQQAACRPAYQYDYLDGHHPWTRRREYESR